MVTNEYKQRCDEIIFGINRIKKVAQRRKDEKAIAQCEAWIKKIKESPSNNISLLRKITVQAILLCDKMEIVVQFEIRRILFPLKDIQNSADEAGNLFAPEQYFHWLENGQELSQETIMKLLEGDIDDLKIAETALKNKEKEKT